jgi:hypothetical protein
MTELALIITLLSAEPPHARLRWSARPSACEETDLRHAVEARLGYDAFMETASTLVDVEVAALDGKITVNRQNAPPAIRIFSGARDCRALFDAMGLALALAIDPLMMIRSSPPVAPSPPPEPPDVVRIHIVERPPDSTPARPWHVSLHAAAGLEIGALPSGWLGFRAGARLARGYFGVTGGPYLLAPAHAAFATGAVDTVGTGADVGACFHLGPVSGCVAGRVGALHFDGRDLDEAHRGWVLAAEIGPRVTFEWPPQTMFGVFAAAELWVPLTRTRMFINGAVAWEQPVVTGSIAGGVTWRGP